MCRHCIIALGFLAALGVCFPSDSADQVCGRVVDEHGDGISAALVVSSGGGLQGWIETGSDGSFCVKYAGAFISVRHRGFSPALLPTSEVRQSSRIQLAKGAAVKILPSCKSLPKEAHGSEAGCESTLFPVTTRARSTANTIRTGISTSTNPP